MTGGKEPGTEQNEEIPSGSSTISPLLAISLTEKIDLREPSSSGVVTPKAEETQELLLASPLVERQNDPTFAMKSTSVPAPFHMAGQKAIVLYDFEAENPEELNLTEGAIVKVVDIGADDGWWLGESNGNTGIFPESYVQVIEDGPIKAGEIKATSSDEESQSDALHTLPGPPTGPPSIPQRRECQGGVPSDSLRKSYNIVNRLSTFVKVGAEEYLLGQSRIIAQNDDALQIVEGPYWEPCAPMTVTIGAPKSEKKFHGMKSYISYTLTPNDTNIMVRRRYKHFDWLYCELKRKYVFIAMPPLPPKQLTGIFSEDFVHRRMIMLQQWLDRVCEHPVLQKSPAFRMFIRTEQDSAEWKKEKRLVEVDPLRDGSIFAAVKAPPGNLPQDVDTEMLRFKEYVKGLTSASYLLNATFDNYARFGGALAREHQRLADSIMLLAKPPAEGSMTACWRPNCAADATATRGLMVTAQALDSIGQMSAKNFPQNVQQISDITKEYVTMIPQYEAIVDIQSTAAHRAHEAQKSLGERKLEASYASGVCDRYEIISNIALAEANFFHAYKERDLKFMMKQFLDGQIDHFKKVVAKLEKARDSIEEL